jgi:hypothetical protein
VFENVKKRKMPDTTGKLSTTHVLGKERKRKMFGGIGREHEHLIVEMYPSCFLSTYPCFFLFEKYF